MKNTKKILPNQHLSRKYGEYNKIYFGIILNFPRKKGMQEPYFYFSHLCQISPGSVSHFAHGVNLQTRF